ncbi:MAG: hypothetical protein A2161_20810 [Candidatus Schekmanbacteria bacterium RBG_13_48_7]|uniref:acylphosphatase n=1 Tax=Candidatus Schekmanbacteria bacterium RBG_13_48_7 TaxID=1817878 RepID=A0A1F7RVF5_9BACT|nr:MAG: hypothetical protein A2161_20810 [Candidatus Schekmanbacteria bacterium RBG_13_48_7]
MSGQKAFQAIVKGRVQGVNFRYYTKLKADELGIKGEVKNLPDGSVYVRAEADEEILKEFQTFISNGPKLARVDDISFTYYSDFKYDLSFKITY